MKVASLASNNQMFSLLELDKVGSLANDLGLSLAEPTTKPVFSQVIRLLLSELTKSVSGIVTEPTYGLPELTAEHLPTGLALALDQHTNSEFDPVALPTLQQNWGVVAVRNNYAAAKVTLYYHPEEESALKKKQLIAELYDHCKHEGIELILKLVLYTKADEEFSLTAFQEDQLAAVTEFRGSCHLLALQYPQDALACATLTTELDIPWVVIGDGQEYDSFKEIVRDSLEGGAKGFLAGETFWRELGELHQGDTSPDLEAMEKFVTTTARDRVLELVRIVEEFG